MKQSAWILIKRLFVEGAISIQGFVARHLRRSAFEFVDLIGTRSLVSG